MSNPPSLPDRPVASNLRPYPKLVRKLADEVLESLGLKIFEV